LNKIYVYAGWLSDCPLIGEYGYEHNFAMFRYSDYWLENGMPPLSPEAVLIEGWQYSPAFGFISDSSPDRWGKGLLERKERYLARKEKRHVRTLTTEDYLLGISDLGRNGGLRYKSSPEGDFLSVENDIPKITDIRNLEHSSRMYNNRDEIMNERWLADILAPGSSLGGARPKANVIDTDGTLWIAKFPKEGDNLDIGAWEMVANRLAKECGINVPDAKLMYLSDAGHTFLSKRFDRTDNGGRIHAMSAMTAFGITDSDSSKADFGFLNIAEFISNNSNSVSLELRELYKRVVFSVCISNTDCHLRNHEFILHDNSWSLSPAYDMNPNIEKSELAIPIGLKEKDISIDLVKQTAMFYRLSDSEADTIISDIGKTIVKNLEKFADEYGIRKAEQEYMEPAFLEAEKAAG